MSLEVLDRKYCAILPALQSRNISAIEDSIHQRLIGRMLLFFGALIYHARLLYAFSL